VREQDYRFSKVDPLDIIIPEKYAKHSSLLETLHKTPTYICESLDVVRADATHPINFSYIATCLAGAEENDPINGIDNFLMHTHHWDISCINLDMELNAYPRAAILSAQQKQKYLAILKSHRLF
jgi:hypothetical protein